MTNSQLSRLIAELRFMDINLPDIYQRVTIVDGSIIQIDLDSVNLQRFPHFPISILNFPKLKRISLRYNNLHSIPPEISELKSLEFLDISHNQLRGLEFGLQGLSNLSELRLNHNIIDNKGFKTKLLPNNLYRLHLGNNKLKDVPLLNKQTNLQFISLPSNLISEIDTSYLPKILKYLNLRSNNLSSLNTETIGTLTKIVLYNNPIQHIKTSKVTIPKIYVDKNIPLRSENVIILKNRFLDLRFHPNYPPQFGLSYQGVPFTSVMIFGDKFTGKQTFLENYLKNEFIPESKLFISQNRYMNWDHYIFFDNNRNYQIWYPYRQDFNDPEFRRGILNGFYYAGVIILFFDLTKIETFGTVIDSINQINLFRSHSTPILVVGNKLDLVDNKEGTNDVLQKLKDIEFKTGRVIKYFEISAISSNKIVFETLYEFFR